MTIVQKPRQRRSLYNHATSRFAHMVFPLWLVMFHYTVVATWLGERDCEQTNLNAFMGYWVAMLVTAGAAAVVDALFIRWSRWWKRALMAAWSCVLAMAQFTTWSFMRGKPSKCFSDGPVFTYVSGPVFFWIIQLVVVVAYAVALMAGHLQLIIVAKVRVQCAHRTGNLGEQRLHGKRAAAAREHRDLALELCGDLVESAAVPLVRVHHAALDLVRTRSERRLARSTPRQLSLLLWEQFEAVVVVRGCLAQRGQQHGGCEQQVNRKHVGYGEITVYSRNSLPGDHDPAVLVVDPSDAGRTTHVSGSTSSSSMSDCERRDIALLA